MPEPREYINQRRGKVVLLLDTRDDATQSFSTSHLYQDTYEEFQQAALSLDPDDWRNIRNLMRGREVALGKESIKALSGRARKVNIFIGDETQRRIVEDWAKGSFQATHKPQYALDIAGVPVAPTHYIHMKEKLSRINHRDPLVQFLQSADNPFGADGMGMRKAFAEHGINRSNLPIARAAIRSMAPST